MLTSKDNDLLRSCFGSKYPFLKEKEVLLEHRYTFEKYRGNRIAPSVDLQLCEMARRDGFEREIGYNSTDNISSMRASDAAGHKPFETVHVRRFLFFTRISRLLAV
jgi:hypothetical protein